MFWKNFCACLLAIMFLLVLGCGGSDNKGATTSQEVAAKPVTWQIVIPLQFDQADSFDKNGLARVKQGGKYGYIDKTGKFIISPQFDDANSLFFNDLAPVKQGGKCIMDPGNKTRK